MSKLKRQTFETSRLGEYFSEKELRAQIGHDTVYWPIAIVRELIDNSLDACESVGVAPVIEINLENDYISVEDNGPGIPLKTVEKSLDYLYRVSDKAYYISPTRGQMGNALKVVYAAPYVRTGKSQVEIKTHEFTCDIFVDFDYIKGEPKIKHTIHKKRIRSNGNDGNGNDGNDNDQKELVKKGTFIKVYWENSASLLTEPEFEYFYKLPTINNLICEYSAFNPHTKFILNGDVIEPTNTGWDKWLPDMPTPIHWYNRETFRDLIRGYLAKERTNGHEKTIREFVSEFRGLKSTQKQKAITGGNREYLNSLENDGDIDSGKLSELLETMKGESKTPPVKSLGTIGEEHIRTRLLEFGANGETIKYMKKQGNDSEGLPYIIEVGFAYKTNEARRAGFVYGLNWSPTIGQGLDYTIDNILNDCKVDVVDPILFLFHFTKPRFEFMDRGKTRIELCEFEKDLSNAIKYVTKEYTKHKKHKERQSREQIRQAQEQEKQKEHKVTIKEAVYKIAEQAYNEASTNGQYYANARQILYKARPYILEMTGISKLKSGTFHAYLKDYIEQYNPKWKIVWDARGKIIEPHTNKTIPLGTREVSNYTNYWGYNINITRVGIPRDIGTNGPELRFKNALFIEKEGFTEILQDTKIPQLYDIAIMSTKGLPVKALCDLMNDLESKGVKIYVLHDFDEAGFKILKTLREGTRLAQGSNVTDLGFRYEDIEGLQSERVIYERKKNPKEYLSECGCSKEEQNFLVNNDLFSFNNEYIGERVELNAMSSKQFIKWLKTKLNQSGAEKYIPDNESIEETYKRDVKCIKINAKIREAYNKADKEVKEIPENLEQKVKEYLEKNPYLSWDMALWQIAENMDTKK